MKLCEEWQWRRRICRVDVHRTLLIVSMMTLASLIPTTVADCTMYGSCAQIRAGGGKLLYIPCSRSTPAVDSAGLDTRLQESLLEVCPHLHGGKLCCAPEQLSMMVASLKNAESLLRSCPVCLQNFRRLWCDFTCSPDQASFTNVTNPVSYDYRKRDNPGPSLVSGSSVGNVSFHVSRRFITDLLKSCKDVNFMGSKAMQMVCHMGESCSNDFNEQCVTDCLHTLGKYDTHRDTLMDIDFVIDRPTMAIQQLDASVRACHEESSPGANDGCGCDSCKKSCSATLSPWVQPFARKWKRNLTLTTVSSEEPNVTITPVWERWLTAEGVMGYNMITCIAYVISAIAALLLVIFALAAQRPVETSDGESALKKKIKFAGTYWGSRDVLDDVQRAGAMWYAEVVFAHPFRILMASCIIVVVLCAGMPSQHFVKDPIDTWTQPDSRARLEKSQFDRLFGELPRYTQILLRPSEILRSKYRFGDKIFGPAFDVYFLQHAFELTEKIVNLKGKRVVAGVEEFVTLSDVCYKMIDNNCFVISPFSYFQNNMSLVQEVINRMEMKNESDWNGFDEGSIRIIDPDVAYDDDDLTAIKKEESIEDDDDEWPDAFSDDDSLGDFIMPSDQKTATESPKEQSIVLTTTAVHDAEDRDHRMLQQQERVMAVGDVLQAHLIECIKNPIHVSSTHNLSCFGQYGGPMLASLVFGGWSSGHVDGRAQSVQIQEDADYYILTIAIDPTNIEKAEIWEAAVIGVMKEYASDYVVANFITQRSIEDEIDSASLSDVWVVAIGYIIMAIYIVFGLAQFSLDHASPFAHLIACNAPSGIMASVTIGAAVFSVMGFYGWIGVRATLMCLEVQPFLIFAIGVNNIFLFVKTYQRLSIDLSKEGRSAAGGMSGKDKEKGGMLLDKMDRLRDDDDDESLDDSQEVLSRRILSATCVRVLPSMFSTAFTECVCFISLALSSAPVLKVFSYYASAGVILNFLFTLTIFVPVFVMNMKRQTVNRCCSLCACWACRIVGLDSQYNRNLEICPSRGIFPLFIEKYYSKWIFTWAGRCTTILFHFVLIASVITVIPRLSIGLDEKMAVPKDSYVHQFMTVLPNVLPISLPVHFVVRSTKEGDSLPLDDPEFRKRFCTGDGCLPDSLGSLISEAVRATDGRLIAQSAYNWLDDYGVWLRHDTTHNTSCCMRDAHNGGYCSENDVSCAVCVNAKDRIDDKYARDLLQFTRTMPSKSCPTSGGMAHRESIAYNDHGRVEAFYLRSFHASFRTSEEYIDGLALSRSICDQINRKLQASDINNVEVFPYSFYYVYYDQYLFIATSTISQLSLSAGVAFVGLMLSTVSPTSALIVAVNTLSSTLLLVGYMWMMSIELNALTIVNLAMSLGIDLEFYVHLIYAYTNSGKLDRVERSTEALVNVGSTVFTGIIITKMLGLLVLSFAHSQIFETYYFLFYLGLIPIGSIHALLFLPVQLTFFVGPEIYERRYLEAQRLKEDREGISDKDESGGEGKDDVDQLKSIVIGSEPPPIIKIKEFPERMIIRHHSGSMGSFGSSASIVRGLDSAPSTPRPPPPSSPSSLSDADDDQSEATTVIPQSTFVRSRTESELRESESSPLLTAAPPPPSQHDATTVIQP